MRQLLRWCVAAARSRRRHSIFGVQVAVSAVGLALGAGMLASGRGSPAVYLPVVTSIVGYWLPAPRPGGPSSPSPSGPQDAAATAGSAQSSVGSVAS